jgi:hypothetical protein
VSLCLPMFLELEKPVVAHCKDRYLRKRGCDDLAAVETMRDIITRIKLSGKLPCRHSELSL